MNLPDVYMSKTELLVKMQGIKQGIELMIPIDPAQALSLGVLFLSCLPIAQEHEYKLDKKLQRDMVIMSDALMYGLEEGKEDLQLQAMLDDALKETEI